MNYREYQQQIAPPWLRNENGKALWRALGDVKDSLLERTRQSVLSRFPDYAAPDALAEIGQERSIDRGVYEPQASYAARLKAAWDAWEFAGTATGVLSALYYAGYTSVELVSVKGRRVRRNSATGLAELVSNNPDGYNLTQQNFWNTFVVYFYELPAHWNDVIPSSSSIEANNVRTLIRRWKTAHAIVPSIIINPDGDVWGDGGEWGDGTWGSAARVWSFDIQLTWGSFAYGDGSHWL